MIILIMRMRGKEEIDIEYGDLEGPPPPLSCINTLSSIGSPS